MIVRKHHAKHCPWQDAPDGAFDFDGFFRIHYVDPSPPLTKYGVEGGKAGARLHKLRQ
jgi:hypothetical protein